MIDEYFRLNYTQYMKFTKITIDPNQMDGTPCIRGLRIPVSTVVQMAADMTAEEIIQALPDLKTDDIREALQYAAASVQELAMPYAVSL